MLHTESTLTALMEGKADVRITDNGSYHLRVSMWPFCTPIIYVDSHFLRDTHQSDAELRLMLLDALHTKEDRLFRSTARLPLSK